MIPPCLLQPVQGYQPTITAITVHPEGVNPVYGEGATTVRLEDEAGGPFIVLEQRPDHPQQDREEIRLDFDEVEALVQAIAVLRSQRAVGSELAKSTPLRELTRE